MAKIIGRVVTTPPPKKLSKYENDQKYVTETELNNKGYAKATDIPTDYAKETHTHSDLAPKEHTHSQYLTQHQSLANYYKKTETYSKSEVDTKTDELSREIVEHEEQINYFSTYVTPQMYGAKADGKTDDTQALFNALNENSEVYLPKGEYVISQSIDLTNGKKLFSHNHEGTIVFNGTGSVFYLGRRTRINGIKVKVNNASVTKVFDTDNRIFSTTTGNLQTEVDDIEVYFNVVTNATLINIMASNKDYLGTSGFHNQHYSNIQVVGQSKIEYGIKICVSFDNPYDGSTNNILPWITNMRFNHIWLGSPSYAIKIYRENNSGTSIDYSNIVRTEHMMFTDVASQDSNSEHTKKFYDVEWCMAEFINCQPWDYHHVTNRGEKYNVIRQGARISEVNARRSPIDVAEFPSVTNITPQENPLYFLETFFNFQSNIDGKYDFTDMKVEKAVSQIELDEAKVESIAQNVVDEAMSGIYYNVMADEKTQVKVKQRYSSSSNSWVSHPDYDALIIPIKQGTNLIRWQGNDLSSGYQGMYFSDDLESYTLVGEHKNLIVTNGDDTYLEINNSGYAYLTIPFMHTEPTMNANNMIVTINQLIKDSSLSYVSEHINNANIHVTQEDKSKWNGKSDFSGSYKDLTDKPTIPTNASDVGAVANTETLTMVGVDTNGSTHTWTIYGKEVS